MTSVIIAWCPAVDTAPNERLFPTVFCEKVACMAK
jgi:hypothetical protein